MQVFEQVAGQALTESVEPVLSFEPGAQHRMVTQFRQAAEQLIENRVWANQRLWRKGPDQEVGFLLQFAGLVREGRDHAAARGQAAQPLLDVTQLAEFAIPPPFVATLVAMVSLLSVTVVPEASGATKIPPPSLTVVALPAIVVFSIVTVTGVPLVA